MRYVIITLFLCCSHFANSSVRTLEVVEIGNSTTIYKSYDENLNPIFYVVAGVATAYLPDIVDVLCRRQVGDPDVCNAVYAVTTALVQLRGSGISRGIAGLLNWTANKGSIRSSAMISTQTYNTASLIKTVFDAYKTVCDLGGVIPWETVGLENMSSCMYYGKYVFASHKYLTKEELKSYSSYSLSVMRNEIFARHGYKFHINSKVIKHFESQTWYYRVPYVSEDSELILKRDLSAIEQYNVQLIKQVEESRS